MNGADARTGKGQDLGRGVGEQVAGGGQGLLHGAAWRDGRRRHRRQIPASRRGQYQKTAKERGREAAIKEMQETLKK